MGVLKGIGYLIAAVAVFTALCFGGLFIIIAGFALGIFLDVAGAVLFTAAAIRVYFTNKK